jgi:hypothetical protein
MFKKLTKSRLTKSRLAAFRVFRPFEPRRVALRGAGFFNDIASNDNRSGFRRPKGQRRIPTPALACHWFDRNGRLECRWEFDSFSQTTLEDSDSGCPDEPTFSCKRSGLAVAAT